MKGDQAGRCNQDLSRAVGASPRRRAGRDREPAVPPPIDELMLRNYLADALCPEESARVEKALRDSAELRARLEDVRQNRGDGQLHTLGAIWRRARLTCPNREKLGSFLLDALDPELASYIHFHLEVIECPFCQANIADLKTQSQATTAAGSHKNRHRRILQASQHMLGEEKR
jgi:hypothetical protein